jgi:transcriptional regulator with XRE-family HTH domain
VKKTAPGGKISPREEKRMGKAKLKNLAARLTMVLLRTAKRLEQGWIAEAVHISPKQASDYERGERRVPREVLDRVAMATGFSVGLLDTVLRAIRSFLVAGRGRSRAGRALPQLVSWELLALAREAADLTLAPGSPRSPAVPGRPQADDRARDEPLRACLRERCTPADARLLVEEAEEYRSWTVCEQAALLGLARAANHPSEALEWAKLAVDLSDLVPGDEAWRRRLRGWTLHVRANAERVSSDLPAADGSLALGAQLWEAEATEEPALLNPAVPPWIDANLRRAQRRLGEARGKIDEALALDGGELRAQILLSKSNILRRLDDPEGSTTVLLEAEALLDARREPRLALIVQFNLLVDLCDLGRAAEAQPRLAGIRALAEQLGEPLDLTRCTWLHGKVEAGLGHAAQAIAALGEVRRELRERELAYSYALASLDLSLLLVELGRSAEVAAIAQEMLWIFKSQGVHREALAALRLFCEAANREAATVELARKVERYLRRAELDPELAFLEDGNGRR